MSPHVNGDIRSENGTDQELRGRNYISKGEREVEVNIQLHVIDAVAVYEVGTAR